MKTRELALACLLAALAPAVQAQSDFKVTLLGTASPTPRPDRFGPSTLVEAGDQKLLFDAGRGVPIRLRQIGVPIGRIDALFITHYHSDHVSGIPDVWLTGWLAPPFGRRTAPFRVIGPTGAKALMDNLERAYALDVKIRLEDEKLPPEGVAIAAEDFDKDGVVYEKSGVKVIAFAVEHGAAIKPAVGYRVEYKGRSVTLSGDTRYDENVVKNAAGTDLLVHEVAAALPSLVAASVPMQRIIAHHTTPLEAGAVFSRTKPKLAVYSHIVLLSSEKIPEPTLDDVIVETRKIYPGPLVVGEDLMSFEIGDGVSVHTYKK